MASDVENGCMNNELLEHFKRIDVKVVGDGNRGESFKHRLSQFLEKIAIKSVLQHLGLLFCLTTYCVMGGLVSLKQSATLIFV